MALLGIYGQATINQGLLHDSEWMRAYLGELPALIGMTPVGEPVIEEFPHWPGGAPSGVQFIDGGNTGVQVLKESAITIHTYPEHYALELVIDSCNPIPNADTVGKGLRDLFGLQVPYGGLINCPGWSWGQLAPKGFIQGQWWRSLRAPRVMDTPSPDDAWDKKIDEQIKYLRDLSFDQQCWPSLTISFDQTGYPHEPHIHWIGDVSAGDMARWFHWAAGWSAHNWLLDQIQQSLKKIGEV